MNAWAHELRLVLRSRLNGVALALLLLVSALAVHGGLREVAHQRATIERLAELERQDLAAQARRHLGSGDMGNLAYYSFHGTWNPPAPAAFLALGLRDAVPFALRVRALALQGQLHEGEAFHPELALLGRFDLAFVLIYLAPLFLIALLYNLVSGERQAGRLQTLCALPGAGPRLWLRRAGVRVALVFAGLALPLLVGAAASGMSAMALATVLLATAAYLGFWSGLCLWIAAGQGSEATHAIRLVGAWVLLTLVVPTVAHAIVLRSVPVRAGLDLVLAQREQVHGAWDIPREEVMARFLATHPQWQQTAPLPSGFHWKWYFAFQHLADEDAAPQAQAYREGLLARQRWTDRLGWLVPTIGMQSLLHRQAGTDLPAQVAYQDRIAQFHARLRAFYEPFLFEERRAREADLQARPRFERAAQAVAPPVGSSFALWVMALLLVGAGVRALRRVSGPA